MNNELANAQTLIEQTGMNVLLLGKAGTGKTTFLRNLYERGMKRMIILAPTGVAAMNAGGTTIHSFFQLPLSPFVPDTKFRTNDSNAQRRFNFSKEKRAIIRSIDLLVIDEISMVRADLLDAVDQVLRRFRTDHNKPFGGVQLLLIGDLAQLAPVVTERDKEILRDFYPTPFFYGSKALQMTPYVSIELTKVYRQTDKQFLNILNEIRNGKVTQETLSLLNERYKPEAADTSGYIRLTTHNRTADEYNQRMLNEIPQKEYSYRCKVEGDFPENLYPVDEELKLKEGAQVMFCKNDSSPEHMYYNGKIAQVIELEKDKIVVQCLEDDEIVEVPQHEWTNSKYSLDSNTHEIVEEIEGRFFQFPLRLAWAITIHKSQGLTFDHCIIDAEHSFASGQVYVALSRCRTLEGLLLSSPISTRGIIVEQAVRDYLDDQTTRSKNATEDMNLLRKDYYTNLISEMYDFTGIYQAHERVQRILQDSYVRKMPSLVSRYNEAYIKVKPELIDVADKFRMQYSYMISTSADYEKDEKIKERLTKGTEYFVKKLKEIYSNIKDEDTPPSENKEVMKRMETAFADFKDILRIKMQTLKSINISGFSTTNYLKAKAKAATADVQKKKKGRRK